MSNPQNYFRSRPHPWHGLAATTSRPGVFNTFIEITPFDVIKYEVDKVSGYLRVDRPQRMTSVPPTLYGFIPRTYCGARVGALCPGSDFGDRDPLDICVLSERPISRAEITLNAKILGGLQMIDKGEADDKIVAVLENDFVWGEANEINDLPKILVSRLVHYFSTYKMIPGESQPVEISQIYGKDHALAVIEASRLDYDETFGDVATRG